MGGEIVMQHECKITVLETKAFPETDEEREWLEKQNFKNSIDDAYTG